MSSTLGFHLIPLPLTSQDGSSFPSFETQGSKTQVFGNTQVRHSSFPKQPLPAFTQQTRDISPSVDLRLWLNGSLRRFPSLRFHFGHRQFDRCDSFLRRVIPFRALLHNDIRSAEVLSYVRVGERHNTTLIVSFFEAMAVRRLLPLFKFYIVVGPKSGSSHSLHLMAISNRAEAL